MTFHDKSKLTSSSLQCLHCKKTDHEKLMCFIKYSHKKKKLDAAWAVKKKNKLLSSNKFSDKFFNNIKLIFNKSDNNVTTLSFMSVIESHLMSVWIVNTEAFNHRTLRVKIARLTIILRELLPLTLGAQHREALKVGTLHFPNASPAYLHDPRSDHTERGRVYLHRFWDRLQYFWHRPNTGKRGCFSPHTR